MPGTHKDQHREVVNGNVAAVQSLSGEHDKTNGEHDKTNTSSLLAERAHRVSLYSQISSYHMGPLMGDHALLVREDAIAAIIFFLSLCTCCLCCCNVRPPKLRRQGQDQQRNVHMHKGKQIYEWDQEASTANIYIQPPPEMIKTDMQVGIRSHDLKVGRKGKAPFLKEQFYAEIVSEKSSWTFEGGEVIITLKKKQDAEWPYVLKHRATTRTSSSPVRSSLRTVEGSARDGGTGYAGSVQDFLSS
jgi:hypothetical protein